MGKEDNDWVKKCMERQTKENLGEIVERDCQAHKLNREDAVDCIRWMKQIRDD